MPKKTPIGKQSRQAHKAAPSSSHKPTPQEARASGWNDPLKPQQPLVSGKWLLSAIGIVLALAAICAYAALCLLFYQGSWQLIFHPSHVVNTTPASMGIAYDEVRFDYTETGKPQLNGWWIPAGADANYPANTILLLRDGRGSLSDSVQQIQALHALGINVFAFDYRGFGKSESVHPSEEKMNQDADATLEYLTSGTRHLPAKSIILYGTGLGASVAASTAARHREITAAIMENASPDAFALLAADSRTKLLPVHLLTADRFDASESLAGLAINKLFLERGNSPQTEKLFHIAGYPKQLFQIAPEDQARYLDTLRRFLDGALQHP
jgi:uncharacterized protein